MSDYPTAGSNASRRESQTGSEGVLIGPPVYGRTPRALLRDPGISPQAKAVWALLEDHASPDSPMPFPSQDTLAEYMGVTARSVRSWLAELEQAGWLEIVTESTPRGKRNTYRMMWNQGKDTSGGEGGVRKSASGPMRKNSSGRVRKPASSEEEPVEEEPVEENSSQSDFQRAREQRQRDERNRNVDPARSMVSDWSKVLGFARQGQHRWSENEGLSPLALAAAREVAVTIRYESETTARAAFFEAWKFHALNGAGV